MTTVRSVSGYRVEDLGLGTAPGNGESFTIPITGPNYSFLIEDDDATASGDSGDTSNDATQRLFVYRPDGTLDPNVNGDTFYVEASFTITVNGATFTAYYIEINNAQGSENFLVLPPNVPPGVATISGYSDTNGGGAASFSYDLFESGNEIITDVGNGLDFSGADTLYAGAGNDRVLAAGGNDLIYGGTGNDTLSGEAGADSILGEAGNDTIFGGADNDTIDGGVGNDSIDGGAGNDSITGGGGQDTITGGDGNDTIQGDLPGSAAIASQRLSFNWSQLADPDGGQGPGIDNGDNLNAGVSQDTGGIVVSVTFRDDGDAAIGGTDDAFDFNSADTQYVAGINSGAETVNATSALKLSGTGGATAGVNNGTSNTSIRFTASNPSLDGAVTNVSFRINDIDTNTWRDIVRITAFDANGNQIAVTLTESANNRFDLSDTDAVAGNDTATALTGANGGFNTNVGQPDGSMLVTIAGPVARIDIDYGNLDTGAQRIDVTDIFFDTIPSTFDDSIDGGAGTDTILGQAGNDILNGGADNDSIDGGVGNDTINGGTGNDSLVGGEGADVFLQSNNFGTDQIFGGSTGTDNDTINASGLTAHGVNIVLTANENGTINDQTNANGNFTDIENFVLSNQGDLFNAAAATNARTIDGLGGNDSLIGGSAADSIQGGTGDDTIAGRGGNDSLSGGAGIDTLDVSENTGNATVNLVTGTATGPQSGNDTISLFENVVTGSGNDSITGDGNANSINSGAGNDSIAAGAGNDTVVAGAGDDTVQGGLGNDSLDGGAGIDTADYSTATGPVTVNLANQTATGADGNDILVNFENITGSANNDSLTGDGNANTIDGGAGNDSIAAGAGNDSVIAGAGDDTVSGGAGNDSLNGGAGIDTLDVSENTGNATVNFVTGTATGPQSGNDTFTLFENVVTGSGNDTIIGDGNANTIDSGAGNDVIRSGGGADSVIAGAGNDTVEGGAGNDRLDGGAGRDLADYSNAPGPVTVNLANQTATGADGNDVLLNFEDVVGGSGNDTITGDGGPNSLDGGGGNDTISGGGGDDTVVGGGGNDTLDGGTGNDTLYGGAGSDSVGGGDGNDTLFGGGGPDTLDGGIGNDTLVTEGGDTLFGGGGNDTANFNDPAGGNDVSITIDTTTLVGSDTAGGVYGGVENFTADELDGPDADAIDNDSIAISNVLTPADVVDIDNTATGVFTPATGGGGPIAFGGPGQPTLSDLFIGGPGGGPRNGSFQINGGDTDGSFGGVTIQNFEDVSFSMVCFTRGTMIATASGEVAIEELAVGDLVLTRDGGAKPLRWIGSRTVPAAGKLAPVVIKAGAMRNHSDLKVSPLHRMLVSDWRAELMFGAGEVLIAAKDLVNGDTIHVAEGGEVEYFHILFDRHEIVTANGAASESFHPGETSMSMLEEAAREEILTIFPELRADVAEGYGQAALPSLKTWEAKALRRA